ncbi:MAG TPA: hypothetical protein PKI20_08860 [Verrucomicrobiota bacterium]|nr:hypothetical protein [Verrucomicrobiota bacterium]HQL77759.1 hypothetical protein [Verrucomicrobiota bacterium]
MHKPTERRTVAAACSRTLAAAFAGTCIVSATAQELPGNLVGLYIHQHWPYNHPYAARTWKVEDYRGYCGGLKALGYNTVMIWPVLETMPSPPTRSDRASLKKVAEVIDMLHRELGMRVYIALCPNVGVKDEEARKAPFEKRHFFYCDTRVNPADPKALNTLIEQRKEQFRPLAKVDGVAIIDSDPAGYPGSTNADFVNLLMAYRKMFDSLRPGIELVYWVHVGWPAYGRWYKDGKFNFGTEAEYVEALTLLKQKDPRPWGIANGLKYAEKVGVADKVIAFNYGRIEGEPSLPMTRFDFAGAHEAGKSKGPRGVMGNAQTHCVQLPNTFAFARGAAGKTIGREDFVQFAEELIPGQGELIVQGWESFESGYTAAMRVAADRLEQVPGGQLKAGPLKGLLFGEPKRFVGDLVCMLRLKAAFLEFVATSESGTGVKTALGGFTDALEAWYKRTGYQNVWSWPKLAESLAKLHSARVDRLIERDIMNPAKELGATPFERVANSLRRSETFTPDLIAALRETLREML